VGGGERYEPAYAHPGTGPTGRVLPYVSTAEVGQLPAEYASAAHGGGGG